MDVRSPPLLTLRGITKRFPGVRALHRARLDVWAGEVHVLFGENGAGKSTLINLIAGVYAPDAGQMQLDGHPLRLRSVQDARRQGIAAMFQEFSLAPHLSVAENLLLGNEPNKAGLIHRRRLHRMAREALASHGFALDVTSLAGSLSRAQQQMVEMTKAMLARPKILILDEPTASLSERETRSLFRTLHALKAQGVAILYITHRLREIEEVADRITVMRDGSFIACLPAARATEPQLIELMTGRKIGDLYPPLPEAGTREVLRAENLHTRDGCLKDISLVLREGEILGLAGLVGCGKSEIGRALFGLLPLAGGHMYVNGEHLTQPTPKRMLARGLTYLTSDRRAEGLLLQRPVRENMALSALPRPLFSRCGWLRLGAEKRALRALAEQLHLRPLDMEAPAVQYSGGNQQKILIARALARNLEDNLKDKRKANAPKPVLPILIFDEPTTGVDVGARGQIYQALIDLAQQGCAIVLISSDMPEILNLCHRVCVIRDGTLVDHLERPHIDEARILRGFFQDATHTAGLAVPHPKEGIAA